MNNIWRIVITLAIILVPFFIFVWLEKNNALIPWAIIAAICIFVINFDKFRSFTISAGKVEATLKEAEQVIEEAQTTIQDLKNTTEPLITFSLAQLTQSDLIHGVDARDKEALYKRAKQLVNEFEITDERTHELLKNSLSVIYLQYLTSIEFACSNHVPVNFEHYEGGKTVREFFSRIKKSFTEDRLATNPNVIRNFFKENPSYNNESVQKLIDAYDTFIRENIY